MFEWNPVFNFAMNIKHNYLEKFGKVEYKNMRLKRMILPKRYHA